ncbi:hypothetical protein GF359_05415 [candidate division WOR-3 bacterium]|uniref:Uncharacterized protein n=1 Tax=candidate division WOR-3 bacterium TaxID=2052148 RepID=A0A9D5QCJ7_UNCW3|nr:hypothetical protein [candidate division WOR-3 bacterium]MBD3364634.1 hypothetical protein [candidate division WOR-3 bacterium]
METSGEMKTSTITRTEKETKVAYKGLCSTCKNARHCVFPRSADRPIMHCDEFEGIEGPKTKVTPRLKPEAKTEETRFKGLCRNCENRHHCVFPKPPGGVWHCDEYR